MATGTSQAAKRAGWLATIGQKIGGVLPGWFKEFAERSLKALEGATGVWIEENIEQGYREIVRNYEPGDRIFLFGFSRGAYTARCIAGVIQRCGLLKAENIRFTPDVVTIYRRRKSGAEPPILIEDLVHPKSKVRVHVLGLWDTVASLGLPLCGWWFRIGTFWRNKSLDSNPAALCEYVYHAMSMDEQRSQFFPTVTTPNPKTADQNVRQVWFRGAHADVGGGYASRSLGDIGLEWMLQIAQHHGLQVRKDMAGLKVDPTNGLPLCLGADPMGKMHDEIKTKPYWIMFGSWPRWSPVPRPGWSDRSQRACTRRYGYPHNLVYRRALQAARLWLQRPAAQQSPRRIDALMARDGLVFLGLGDVIRIAVSARAPWNRTGIVFECGATYRLTYVGGQWRDGEKQPCGAAGQRPYGMDGMRRASWRSRRVDKADWLELIGHVAHPRNWPVEEFGFYDLLKFVFRRDPRPLTRSLLPLGRHMRAERDSVYVMNLADSGLFYAFANDAWVTYANNSGAIELEIERVAAIPHDAEFYSVTPRGEVITRKDTPPDLRELIAQRNAALMRSEAPARTSWPDLSGRSDIGLEREALAVAPGLHALSGEVIAFNDAARIAGARTASEAYVEPQEIRDLDDQLANRLRALNPTPPEAEDVAPAETTPAAAPAPDAATPWKADWDRSEV